MKAPLAAAALLLLPMLAPTLAHADGMAGPWAVNGAFDSMGVKFSLVCNFTQVGAKISGPCKDPQQPSPNSASGSVSGPNVEFAYDTVYMGVSVHLTYKGVMAANGAISGGIDAGTVQGTFTAARAR